jgi:hypothetical protein
MVNQLKEVLSTVVALVPILAVFMIVVALVLTAMRVAYATPKKHQVIRTYAKRVGKLLRDRYGQQEQYTPAQVKKILRERRYHTPYDCYALAMYCSHDDLWTITEPLENLATTILCGVRSVII